MTEHDRGFTPAKFDDFVADCHANSTPTLRFIPGIEYSDPENCVHILVWGCSTFIGENLPSTELFTRLEGHDALVVLAHPDRREAWRRVASFPRNALHGVEIWNRKSDGWAPSRSAHLLLRDHALRPFVGLDFHQRRHRFPLRMHLDVRGTSNPTDRQLVAALRTATPRFLGRDATHSLRGPVRSVLSAVNALRSPFAHLARRAIAAR